MKQRYRDMIEALDRGNGSPCTVEFNGLQCSGESEGIMASMRRMEEGLDDEAPTWPGDEEEDTNPGILVTVDPAWRPCPFCGAEGTELFIENVGFVDDGQVRVSCRRCETEGPVARTEAEATWAWNGFL